MNSKSFVTAALAALTTAALLCALSARAAVITWSTPTTIAGDTDVSTAGTLVVAYSLNNVTASIGPINGVTFVDVTGTTSLTNVGSAFTMNGFTTRYTGFGGGTSNPYNSLSSNYKTLLEYGYYVGNVTTVPVITIQNLTIGEQYAVQVWANDSRTGRPAADYANVYSSGGGNNVAVHYNSTGAVGGVGQWTTGTFVADATTQTFVIFGNSASGQGDTYLNAIQLRDLGPDATFGIGYWNGQSGSGANATLDTTSPNFCTNVFSAPVGTADSLADLVTVEAALSAPQACWLADYYYSSSSPIAVSAYNLNVAAGGVSIGAVNFVNSTALTYTLTSADANGIAGATVVNKAGYGTVIFDGANSYSGGTAISAGTLQVGAGDANGTLGSGPVGVTNVAALVFNRSDSPTFANVISGGGTVTQEGSGTLTLSGANTYTNRTTITNGTLAVSNMADSPGTSGIGYGPVSLLNGGTLAYTGAGDTTARAITVAAGNNFGISVAGSAILTVNGVFTGTSPGTIITKTGTGTLVLGQAGTAASSYFGMNINAGTVILNKNSQAIGFATTVNSGGELQLKSYSGQIYSGSTAPITVNSGGLFDLNGQGNTLLSLSLSGTGISGSGALINSAASTTSTLICPITLAANTTIGGSTSLGNIILLSTNLTSYGSSLTYAGMGTLTLSNANPYFSGGMIVNAGTLVGGGSGTIAGNATVNGGTLDGQAAGSIVGNVTVNGGTLELDSASAMSAGATLTLPGSPSPGTVNLTFTGTQNILALYVGSTPQPPGTYGSTGSSATYKSTTFTGNNGVLNVGSQGYYWDANGADAYPGSGGTSNWDNTISSDWFNGSSDTLWTPDNVAIFAATPGTVTVNDNVAADGLTFLAAGYTLNNTNGVSVLTLAGPAPTITVPAGTPTTISAAMAGTSPVTVSGPGTLILSGANTYTGGTTVNNGATLSVNSIADTGASALGPSGSLTLGPGGGTLAFTGVSATSARTVTVSGATTDTINVPSGGTLTLNGQVKSVSGSAPQMLTFTGGGTLYLGGVSNDNSGLTMAIDAGTVIISKTTYASAHGLGGGTSTVGSGATLQLAGSGGYDLYSTCVLIVTNGGVLDLNGQSDTITTLTLAGAGPNGATYPGALINSSGVLGEQITVSSGIVLAGNTTIGGPGNITTPSAISGAGMSLTYAGTGILVLGGAGTYSGGLTINSGATVQLNNITGAGTGTIAIQGNGVLTLNAAGTYANAITGGQNSVMNVNEPSGNTFITGDLSGFTGTINCNSANGTTGQLVINNANNAAHPLSASATWNIANGATVDLATPYTVDAASVIVNGVGNNQIYGSLRLDACNQTGTVLLNGPNVLIGDGNTAAGPSTISGVISDGNHGYGFTKVGAAATIALTAANTFFGPVTNMVGTLALSGSGSIANSSGIFLANGTTLDVSGVNGGTYSLGAGQTLGTLGGSATINGNLDVSSGSRLSFQYTTANAPLQVNNGVMNLNNNPVTVTLTGNTSLTGGATVPLINGVTGNVSGSVVSVPNASLAANPTLSISGGTLYLTVNYPVFTIYSPYTYSNLFIFTMGIPPTFSVTAVGNPTPTYQWYSNGVAISGANSASYTYPTGTLPAGELTNSCVAQNSAGFATNYWVLNVISTNEYVPYPLAVMQSTNASGTPVPPIAYWRLDESDMGGGNANRPCNDWVGGNMGLYTNVTLGQGGYSPASDPTETSAQVGVYATSDSVAYIPVANPNLNMTAANGTAVNLSVECWINAKGQGNSDATIVSQGIFGQNDAFVLAVNANGNSSTRYLRFYCRSANGAVNNATSTVIPSGSWEHLVGVCNESAGTMLLYINGAQVASGTVAVNSGFGYAPSGYSSGGSYPVVIGGEQGAPSGFTTSYQFNGLIDDVAVYNYALPLSTIQAHYNAKGAAPTFALLASTNVDYGAPLALAPTSVVGTLPLYYSWSDTNTPGVVLATTPALTIASAITDKYTLTVSNIFGASANTVTVTAYQGAPSFAAPGQNITPSSLTVYAGRPVTFSVLAYGTYPLSYQWFNGLGAIAGATNTSYTATAALGTTTYYCMATNGVLQTGTSGSATLTGVAPPTSLYSQAILTSNAPPIAYWQLDEQDNGTGNSGVTAYDYVGGHNATYNSVNLQLPGYNPSDPDTAAQFGVYAPSGSYAGEFNNSANGIPPIELATSLTAEFSVEAWAQANGSQADGAGILAKGWYHGGEQFILTSTNNQFCFSFKETDAEYIVCQSAVSVTDGNWHHLVGVCDELNGGAHLYVDGNDVADADCQSGKGVEDPGSSAVQDRVSIGARAASNTTTLGLQFNGQIEDVAIYNYALTAAQALAHYSAGTNQVVVVAPTISAALSGTNLVINFTGTLLYSTNADEPVTNVVAGATSPYTIPATNAQMYFRSSVP